MNLKASHGRTVVDPRAADIRAVLEALPESEDAFALLERSAQRYVQAAGSARSGFLVEYRDGTGERHYRSARVVGLDETARVFVAYAEGCDVSGMLPWESAGSGVSADAPGASVAAASLFLLVLGIAAAVIPWLAPASAPLPLEVALWILGAASGVLLALVLWSRGPSVSQVSTAQFLGFALFCLALFVVVRMSFRMGLASFAGSGALSVWLWLSASVGLHSLRRVER